MSRNFDTTPMIHYLNVPLIISIPTVNNTSITAPFIATKIAKFKNTTKTIHKPERPWPTTWFLKTIQTHKVTAQMQRATPTDCTNMNKF